MLAVAAGSAGCAMAQPQSAMMRAATGMETKDFFMISPVRFINRTSSLSAIHTATFGEFIVSQ